MPFALRLPYSQTPPPLRFGMRLGVPSNILSAFPVSVSSGFATALSYPNAPSLCTAFPIFGSLVCTRETSGLWLPAYVLPADIRLSVAGIVLDNSFPYFTASIVMFQVR